ncbi:MAG: hypothetical protein N3A01_06045 [Bacteroidales bacterium]|nr:hypothetical protein [Bacteroidales bacterium]
MMLDFSKIVLSRVSFDPVLFHKELKKILQWIGNDNNEIDSLYKWCITTYGDKYGEIIEEVFRSHRYGI